MGSWRLEKERFLELLGKLIGEAESLQNSPAQGLHPKEDLASGHVMALLEPLSTAKGGPLTIERVTFTEGRGNLIVTYPGAPDGGSVAFVGAHMDVVPANPENWDRDPFKLNIEGDKLYGRGTTDCLGHVALITEVMISLATHKPQLQRTVAAVFIANEENGAVAGVGVDRLMETGKLDGIRSGPVLWVDSADSQPCIGTAGSLTWTLRANGKLFHSGLPHKGVNALELANAAVAELQRRFYEHFPQEEREIPYNFSSPSTMKPTQVRCAVGSLNQLPPWVEISGDVRLSPFYEVKELREALTAWVADINKNLETALPTFGPASKYVIEGFRGSLELEIAEGYLEGIACSLDSDGHAALVAATQQVRGEAKPYSIGGSLPLVRDLQRGGFDVQITGFGLLSTYHADNEYCLLSDMEKGFQVLVGVVAHLEDAA